MGRWTAVIEAGPGEREEVDVTARTEREARRMAEVAMREDGYGHEWQVTAVHPFAFDTLAWGGGNPK